MAAIQEGTRYPNYVKKKGNSNVRDVEGTVALLTGQSGRVWENRGIQ